MSEGNDRPGTKCFAELHELCNLDELTVKDLNSASRGEDMYRATVNGRTAIPSLCTDVDLRIAFVQWLRRA
eukprot:7500148-Pyramimonas_sp.AAC.1